MGVSSALTYYVLSTYGLCKDELLEMPVYREPGKTIFRGRLEQAWIGGKCEDLLPNHRRSSWVQLALTFLECRNGKRAILQNTVAPCS